MIGWLCGQVMDAQHPGKLVLNVNGVGYDVETPLSTFFQVEKQADAITLHIHTVVREDAFLLYGFLSKEERALFRALIKVNGVGPKMAIGILSSITPAEFMQCIQQQNTAWLIKLPGIGKKTAERLVVEMKDTIALLAPMIDGQTIPSVLVRQQDEAISALEALGYKPQEAAHVIKKIDDGNKTCEQLIRQGLQVLASR